MVTYGNLTINAALNRSRVQYPSRPSLGFVGEQSLTYSQLSILARNTSGMLITLGIEKGDRVAILGENSPNWGIAYFSITCMGAVAVPILPEFTQQDVSKILEHSQAKAIFVSSKQISKLDSGLEGPDKVLLNNLELVLPDTPIESLPEGYTTPNAIFNIDFSDIDFPEPQEEDLAVIIYTSGTTGRPKGVMLTHKNLISNSLSTLQIQEINSTDRLLSVLPLSHTYECTIGFLMPIMQGASVYYLQKPPTAPVLLPAMQIVKPTMMLVVPLVIEKVFKNKILPQLTSSTLKRKLYAIPFFRKLLHKVAAKKLHATFGGCLHFFGIGGSKLSFEVERFLNEGKFPYSIGYGMTEASPLISGSSPNLVRFRCAGFSIPGQDVRIDNPNPDTGEGEVQIKGSNIMIGYYRDEELTREVFTEDGWLKTGDLGYIDADNYIQLRGRLKNMIVGPSGENIYPEDIEEVINSHELVLESMVYEMKGKLIARVHLNYQELEAKYANLKESATNFQQQMQDKASEIQEKVKIIMNEIRQNVNSRVASFSKLNSVQEQVEPFEKTPTQKIKRYLYQKH
jgi:long-chain acyl-CoA synthetase